MLEVIEMMDDWSTEEGVPGSHACPVLLYRRGEDGFLLGEVDSSEEAGGNDVSERVLVAN